MEIVARQEESVTVLAIEGMVDAMTADDLTTSFSKQVENGNRRLVADFTQVSYTSSAGLRALLATAKHARELGGDLRLAGVQPHVHRVLQLSGFTSILKLFPDVEQAIRSYDHG